MLKSISDLLAEFKGEIPETPCYLYSENNLEALLKNYFEHTGGLSLPLEQHFALKSNNNPHVLKQFKQHGLGIDLVSGGELHWALKQGFLPDHLVFSGVGKNRQELREAIDRDIALINVESADELEKIAEIAKALQKTVRVALRVNPNVSVETHPYISTGLREHKFGIDFELAEELYAKYRSTPQLKLVGISIHIGSQLMSFDALDEALNKVLLFSENLILRHQIPLEILDVGGGVGISYGNPSELPNFKSYAQILNKASQRWKALVQVPNQGPRRLYSECGRALVCQAGWLLTRVIRVKKTANKNFLVVDASMSELLRPALYSAKHPIEAVSAGNLNKLIPYEVVGPVCESSDTFGSGYLLPAQLGEGDLIAIGCTGAYGYTMASAYNGRPIPAEHFLTAAHELIVSRPAKFLLA